MQLLPGLLALCVAAAAVVCVLGWAGGLAYCDFRYRRLPDWATLPPGLGMIAMSLVFSSTALWGLGWALLYCVMGMAGGGIGGGDVKLAVSLGVGLAYVAGGGAVLGAVVVSSLFSVVIGLFQKIRGRADRGIPHGPSMLAAAGLCGVVSV